MTHFVLVPGMCHGGWWYAPLVERLEALGHRATAVTPTGLGPDGLQGLVNLDTHVADVVGAAAAAGDDDLVLVGHSYGGMLISGAADRLPGRVAALVYLDALVPRDGDSCYTATNDDERRWYIEGSADTGLTVAPLPFFDERARPHPLATLTQRLDLTGAWDAVPHKVYVEATGWEGESPLAPRSSASAAPTAGPSAAGTPATTSCTTARAGSSSCSSRSRTRSEPVARQPRAAAVEALSSRRVKCSRSRSVSRSATPARSASTSRRRRSGSASL